MKKEKERVIDFYKTEIIRLQKNLKEHLVLEDTKIRFQNDIRDSEQAIRKVEEEISKLQSKRIIEQLILDNKLRYADLLLEEEKIML